MLSTVTFIPHKSEHASHMARRAGCDKKFLTNLVRWAAHALTVGSDSLKDPMHKAHFPRAAGLSQRFAATDVSNAMKRQMEKPTRPTSNQLEDKDQAYLRTVNRTIHNIQRKRRTNPDGEHPRDSLTRNNITDQIKDAR